MNPLLADPNTTAFEAGGSPVRGSPAEVWERQAVDAVHDAVHDLLPGVAGCCYVRLGCVHERLCGRQDLPTALAFERLAGAAGCGRVTVEVRTDTQPGAGRYGATIPIARRGRSGGQVHVLTDTAPDVELLGRVATIAAGDTDDPTVDVGEAVVDDVPRHPDWDEQLDRNGQDALVDLFGAKPDDQPALSGLLQRVARVLDSPVAVQTARFVIIGSAGDIDGLALDRGSRRDQEVVGLAARSAEPILTPARDSSGTRAVVPVNAESGRPHLLIAVVDPHSSWALAVLRQAAGILTWVLRIGRDIDDDVTRRRAAIVADLVRNEDLTGVSARAAALGHDMRVPHWAVVFLPIGEGDERSGADVVRRLEQHVIDSFPRAVTTSERLISVFGRSVVALVPDDDRTFPELQARGCLAAAGRDGLTTVCGIGPRSAGAEEIATGLGKAQRAAAVLRNGPQSDRVVAYEDLGILGLMFSESDRGRLDEFVERWLGPLSEYDGADAVLMTTMNAILDQPTMSAAADSLYVHISTLKYRWKRIEEILGVDLRNPDVTFNLRLATRLRTVQGDLLGRGNRTVLPDLGHRSGGATPS